MTNNNEGYLINASKSKVDRIIASAVSDVDAKTEQIVAQHTGTDSVISLVVDNQWEYCRTAFVKAKGEILEQYLNMISRDPNIFRDSVAVEALKVLSATLTDLENEAKRLKAAEDKLYYAWQARHGSERLKWAKKKEKDAIYEAKRKNRQEIREAKMKSKQEFREAKVQNSLEIQRAKDKAKLAKYTASSEVKHHKPINPDAGLMGAETV
jgi:tRNA/tmRNA/rRNA uracil-C5-methylase (TrmA/RlmC/RlmD family)